MEYNLSDTIDENTTDVTINVGVTDVEPKKRYNENEKITMKNDLFLDDLESWLQFNARVINESRRSVNPIMERLNFIGIADSNLDEFIRTKYKSDNKGLKKKIVEQTSCIESSFDQIRDELLTEYNILLHIGMDTVKEDKKAYNLLKNEFKKKIFPTVQPLILKNELPMPDLDDGGTFVISKLESDDSKGVTGIIRLPNIELIKVPDPQYDAYITNEDVILEFIGNFYRGKNIIWNKIFKVYRRIDSLNIDITSNYIDGIRDQLYKRNKAEMIMVDISTNISGLESIVGDAKKRVRKYVGGLAYLTNIRDIISCTDTMVFNKAKPRTPAAFVGKSMFDILSKRDVLVHFPYESFDMSTLRFLEEAATDNDVISIRQTLYRVSKDSPLTKALINAAKSGKQVVVLLELKAKMDEWNNLKLADELKDAGCHIIFGPTNMKTHAKTTLIVRREGNKIAKYVNISTGNFNDKTARVYEDLSYFAKETKKFRIGDELCELFNYLGGFSELRSNNLLIAPVNFRDKIIEEIDNCIANSETSFTAIIMKMNSLTDKKITKKLYDASRAGVKIGLIVRGMCILIPGVDGMSENIEVISIVGRYLEHSRVYEFIYGDTTHMYIGSGDIMPRNLDHRVEVLVPIKNNAIRTSLHNLLNDYFKDNTNRYILNNDGSYKYPENKDKSDSETELFSIQNSLIKHYKKIEKSIIK